MVQNAVYVWNWVELPSSELELNCLYRNWNWSRINFIGIGIGVELPLSELELELNCLLDWVPDSELEWNCLYRNWNWNWIAKTELTPALTIVCTNILRGVNEHDRGFCCKSGPIASRENLPEVKAFSVNVWLYSNQPRINDGPVTAINWIEK